MSAPGCFQEKVTIISLVFAHVELHIVALRPLSAVIGDVLEAGVSAGVVHKLHSAPALQQVIDHEEEDDGADTSSLGHGFKQISFQCPLLPRCSLLSY